MDERSKISDGAVIGGMVAVLILSTILPAVQKIEANSVDINQFEYTEEFVLEEGNHVVNLNIGYFDDESGMLEIYHSKIDDPEYTDHYTQGYFFKDQNYEDIYDIFEDQDREDYIGWMEIYEEDGVVKHCDLYRNHRPVESFLDVQTVYGLVE